MEEEERSTDPVLSAHCEADGWVPCFPVISSGRVEGVDSALCKKSLADAFIAHLLDKAYRRPPKP